MIYRELIIFEIYAYKSDHNISLSLEVVVSREAYSSSDTWYCAGRSGR